MLALVLASLAAEPPRVDVRAARAALEGSTPSQAPQWTGLDLTLNVTNRLPVAVRDLQVDVTLVVGPSAAAVPGWTFRDTRVEGRVAAQSTVQLPLRINLPRRRHSPAAEDVRFEVEARSFRLDPPALALAVELLGSSAASDQRAALASFEPAPWWSETTAARIASPLLLELDRAPDQPTAAAALRLLLAVRALGSLQRPEAVAPLLALPASVDKEAWGRAVLDLASRVVAGSDRDDPRIELLPRWARRIATLLGVNARDALDQAATDAILRIGDRAVPPLIGALGGPPERAARARSLLEAMGRPTPKSQLAVEDRTVRRAVLEALGALSQPDVPPALVEALTGPDASFAERALLTQGPPALGPLAERLGGPRDARVRDALTAIGTMHPRALARVAAELGVPPRRGEPVPSIVGRLAAARAGERGARLHALVQDAIRLGAQGGYRTAIERIDRVRVEAPEVTERYADPIARLYVGRAEQLLDRGDYEAAIEVLAAGRAVRRLPEADMRLADARLALARGYLGLGDLDRAKEELDAVPIPRADAARLGATWQIATARAALDEGRRAEARKAVERARALDRSRPELASLERRLWLIDNLPVALTFGAGGPALLLAALLAARRRGEKATVEAAARAVDQVPLQPPADRR